MFTLTRLIEWVGLRLQECVCRFDRSRKSERTIQESRKHTLQNYARVLPARASPLRQRNSITDLYDALDHGGDVGEHEGEAVGALGGLQLGPVVRAGAVPRRQVQRVRGRELELGRRGLDVRDDRVQEGLLGLLEELEHRRQDGVGAARLLLLLLTLVLRQSAMARSIRNRTTRISDSL